MKILIVVPILNSAMRPQYNFPVGLANIKAALKQRNYDVIALNLNHKWGGVENVEEYVKKNNVDIVLCGGLSAHYHVIKTVFEAAKSAYKDVITIGGGGGFTSEPILFTKMTGADYACLGEGEVTICELIDAITHHKDFSAVQGIVYKNKDGQYERTSDRSVVENLDLLPFPDYEGFEMENYLAEQTPYDYYFTYISDEPRMFPIFMGRSCPYQCNFCFHPLGNKYRQRSLDNFFEELDLILEKYKVNSLAIFDELFSLKEQRIYDFCDRIKPYGLKWSVQMRVNIINERLLSAMKEAGCFNISYGIESINEKVLNNMQKKINKQEIERALTLTYDAGIGIQGNFIFGDEEEDMDTFSETINWWRNHRKYQLNLAFIETYPGTQLYKNAVKKNLIKDREKFIENNCPIINLTRQPEEVFQRMQAIVSLAEFHDRQIEGKVLKIEPDTIDEDFVVVTLQCYHCKENHTIRRIPVKRIYSNNFKICCRSCNQKSVYDTRGYLNIRDSESKYKMYFVILKHWMMYCGSNDGVNFIDRYFKEHSIRSIAILLDEEIAPVLYKAVKKTKVNIAYVIDEAADDRYMSIVNDEQTISFKDIHSADQVDAIIVAEVFSFMNSRDKLIAAGYSGHIISLEDILFGIKVL